MDLKIYEGWAYRKGPKFSIIYGESGATLTTFNDDYGSEHESSDSMNEIDASDSEDYNSDSTDGNVEISDSLDESADNSNCMDETVESSDSPDESD